MYLIVGLGNPEPTYSDTRHNMGFDVVNKLSKKYKIEFSKKKSHGIYGVGEIEGCKIILLKPQTYMNDSGKSVKKIKKFYKIKDEKLIIVYDDVDIEKAKIRIRQTGSANTHNGMKSVIEHLGTEQFTRIRVGIGQPNKEISNYVLERIREEERKELEQGIDKAVNAVGEILQKDVLAAMNKFN